MNNFQWSLAIGAIGGATYLAIRNKRAPITAEEAEYLRPAPVANLEFDPFPLTPDYIVPRDPFADEGYAPSGQVYGAFQPPAVTSYPGYTRPVNNTALPQMGELVTPTSKPWQPAKPAPPLVARIPDMRIGSANIRNFPDMPPAKVKADARKMAKISTVWGGQEIEPGEDHSVIMEALGSDWKGIFQDRETPIFYRADKWELVSTDQIFLPRGNLSATSKESAITAAVFKGRERSDVKFFVVNCHLITHGPRTKASERPRRRALWREEKTKHDEMVKRMYSKELSGFFLGDYNANVVSLPMAGARWNVNSGIDKIGFVNHPKGIIIKPRGSGEIHRMNSDHPARISSAGLSIRK